MHCLLCLNGEYGDLSLYEKIDPAQLIICADGGANQLKVLGLEADLILGDMDSVNSELLARLQDQGVEIITYPPEKDDTDTQLALKAARERGATRITILGGIGDRFDHTWSSILSTLPLVYEGIGIHFYHPRQSIYIIKDCLSLSGNPGDIISLLALKNAAGVNISGVKYPLNDAELTLEKPYAVSNELLSDTAEITLESGVLMVVHITA